MTDRSDNLIPPKTVLIAGVGRSSTSWLGKILDSSPHVFYKPQPNDVSPHTGSPTLPPTASWLTTADRYT